MEQSSVVIMEKKNLLRFATLSAKSSQDTKSSDFSCKKNGSQYPRKREYEKFDSHKKPPPNRGGRAGQRYVRPREKMGCQVEQRESESEIGSLQRAGAKKQNISHLLNWWGPGPLERFSNHGRYRGSYSGKKQFVQHVKYNKEHYIQANCQFVVRSGKDYSCYEKNPDQLVDWDLIQEVRLHMTEPPACPICLYSPTAAKITRCGHIYCYSCLLHYLALSDRKWRKCPICFDAVTKDDLKSVKAILHKDWHCGEEIELQLMRRDRDSLIPFPLFEQSTSHVQKAVTLCNATSYTKLIVSTPDEVLQHIVKRELDDLHQQLQEEGDQPEACFIEAALSLVECRVSLLSSGSFESKEPSYSDLGVPVGSSCSVPLHVDQEGLMHGTAASKVGFQALAEIAPEKYILPLQTLTLDSKETEIDLKDDTEHQTLDQLSISKNNETVCDELLISEQLVGCHQEANTSQSKQDMKGPKTAFFFYQESSGANVYLHALNVHMLIKEYGSLEKCPCIIKAKVLEKESSSMSETLRQRLRYLRHLPVTCPFEVVEIEMKYPLVSHLTISEFQGQLENRERMRKKKAKEEHRIEKRVKVEEDRLMGRSRGTSINMTSYKHFPTFAEDPPLISSEDEGLATTLATSPQSSSDGFPETSPPSFAQVINSSGHKQQSNFLSGFPSLGASSSHQQRAVQPHKKESPVAAVGSDAEDNEEGEKVPSYKLAFSDAFDKALDRATREVSQSIDSAGVAQRRKKGKKTKGIVVLSSGGR